MYKYDKNILDFLTEIGIYIFEEQNDDIDLREYIVDSLDFIQLIVAVEDYYKIVFPDDLLEYDILSSLVSFENVVTSLIEKSDEKEESK